MSTFEHGNIYYLVVMIGFLHFIEF
jgi:hypothetical protein